MIYNLYIKTNNGINITIKNNKKRVNKVIKQLMFIYGFNYNDIKVLSIGDKKNG